LTIPGCLAAWQLSRSKPRTRNPEPKSISNSNTDTEHQTTQTTTTNNNHNKMARMIDNSIAQQTKHTIAQPFVVGEGGAKNISSSQSIACWITKELKAEAKKKF
jgi:hypothetical protein